MKHSELKKIVLIGASTGGPGQIEKIVKSLPFLENTSIIIAQHLAQGFAKSFASRLDSIGSNHVLVADDKEKLEVSNIYICCAQTSILKKNTQFVFQQKPLFANAYNPDINLLFNSFIPFTNELNILSVILTGIGEDGVQGCKELTLNGARSITESSSSAIVDGMPSRARIEIENIEIENVNGILNKIKEFCS